MTRYEGGTRVKGGYYFNLKNWEIKNVAGAEGELPGSNADKFLHAPTPVLLVAAPVIGAAFAMFLPFIGFAMPVYAVWKKVRGTPEGTPAEANAPTR